MTFYDEKIAELKAKGNEYCREYDVVLPKWNEEDLIVEFFLGLWEFISEASYNDSGRFGKAAEIAVASHFARRLEWSVKSVKSFDLRSKHFGKVEIKTCLGTLNDTEKADTVFYAPIIDLNYPLADQFYIFTKEEWHDFLNGYNGRGQFVVENPHTNDKRIQSFYVSEEVRPKASKAIRRYIDEFTSTLPTLATVWYED